MLKRLNIVFNETESLDAIRQQNYIKFAFFILKFHLFNFFPTHFSFSQNPNGTFPKMYCFESWGSFIKLLGVTRVVLGI